MEETKPSKSEEEFFHKRDAELIAAQRTRLDAERKRAERAAHYMKCPKCGADLVEREFHRVKIDVCTECKGTFLDAGEMELISRIDHSRLGAFVRSILGFEK
ncbi:MAG TPA: zf-TFIIB domain-containing protein [Gemmatimonadaceae bacterium]|nr:zf-TFIIB domain-containing protein [Gemmatimonadaceae bacterium]